MRPGAASSSSRSAMVMAALAATAAAAAAISIGGAGPVSAGGGATTETYPGSCQRGSGQTLQTCIDGLAPGSTIILTAEVIDEPAEITRSLTLRAIDRTLDPILGTLAVIADDASDSLRVRVSDIRMSLAVIRLLDGHDHDIVLERLEIGDGAGFAQGLSAVIDASASLRIVGSRVHGVLDDQESVLSVNVGAHVGTVRLDLLGNTVTANGNPDSGSGIGIDISGAGATTGAIRSNAIWDVARCNCGAAAGITLTVEGPPLIELDVIGNTIERSQGPGLAQRNDLTGSGRLELRLFDNVFSHVQTGVSLESGDGSLRVTAGHNAFFAHGGNSLDGRSLGTGTIVADPRYVAAGSGNLRLRASSPLVDTGLTCPPGGIATLDAAGRGRLAGPAVDIGAYERNAAAPSGVVRLGDGGADTLVGTPGADILCGFGGPDRLLGNGGRDHLDGGAAADRLVGGAGADRLLGGAGDDTLCARDGVAGNDRVDGGPGPDAARTDPRDGRVSVAGNAAC